MYSRLVIDGNAVYEIDEECVRKKEKTEVIRQEREEEKSEKKKKEFFQNENRGA